METMRYYKRECTEQGKINHFLNSAKIGFLGLTDGTIPYVIPLNFVWYKEHIYFHGASEGKKIEIMKVNQNVCFTVSEEYGTISNPVPAHIDTAYMSVILTGKAEKLDDWDEATQAMQEMLNKYVPAYFDNPLAKSHVEKYRSSLGSQTGIFKIVPASLSAKENPWQIDKMFHAGKKVHHDLDY